MEILNSKWNGGLRKDELIMCLTSFWIFQRVFSCCTQIDNYVRRSIHQVKFCERHDLMECKLLRSLRDDTDCSGPKIDKVVQLWSLKIKHWARYSCTTLIIDMYSVCLRVVRETIYWLKSTDYKTRGASFSLLLYTSLHSLCLQGWFLLDRP